MDYEQIKEYLPFLIPLIVIELALLAAALIHVFTHKTYRCGNRLIWTAVIIIGSGCFIGPILYFAIGRDEG